MLRNLILYGSKNTARDSGNMSQDIPSKKGVVLILEADLPTSQRMLGFTLKLYQRLTNAWAEGMTYYLY